MYGLQSIKCGVQFYMCNVYSTVYPGSSFQINYLKAELCVYTVFILGIKFSIILIYFQNVSAQTFCISYRSINMHYFKHEAGYLKRFIHRKPF